MVLGIPLAATSAEEDEEDEDDEEPPPPPPEADASSSFRFFPAAAFLTFTRRARTRARFSASFLLVVVHSNVVPDQK